MCVCARPRGMSKRVGELSWVPGENHRGTLHLTRPMRTYVTWMSIRIYERRYVHVNFYCRLPRCIGGLVVSRLPDAHPPTDLSALPFSAYFCSTPLCFAREYDTGAQVSYMMYTYGFYACMCTSARARACVSNISGEGGGGTSCTHVPRTRRFGDNRLYCRTRTIGSDLDECCEIVRTRRMKEKETDIRMKGSVEQFQICFRHELVFRFGELLNHRIPR